MAEKFRREFSVDLPRYEGGSIEEHLKQVADAAPSTMTWKVRRQVAIGIFPSARMAMYLDLDTTRRDFAGNEVVAGLFGGSGGAGATPFADEHDVDDPAIEAKAPYLVLDADSSQFSTIIDIADGKNLAVEGPPGTGKSQTIVNTIANALAQGKKVLFVAEKMAALEVVKSRLEAVGLGEFLLPLQAERSSREQVVQSVRARLELGSTSAPRDYQNRLEKFRQTRAELAGYIQVISQQFGNTGLKIYDVLGKCIATREPLKEAPKKLQAPSVPNIETMNAVQIETALERARSLAAAWFATGEVGEYWNGIECIPLDPFTALELKRLAQETSGAYERADEARLRMAEFGIDAQLDTESLGRLADQLHELLPLAEAADIAFVSSLLSSGRPAELTAFLADCSRLQREDEELAALVETRHDIETATLLREAAATCAQHGIKTLDEAAWVEDLACRKEAQLSLERAQESLKAFIDYFPVAASIPVHVLAKAGQIVRSTDDVTLSVRSELIAGPGGTGLLDQLCQQGRELQGEREALARRITVETELSPAELRSHAGALRTAGAFGWMSPKVRAAKSIYAGLALAAGFDKTAAVEALQSLAKYREAAQQFSQDVQARSVFGLHFKGVDTDFYPFELLSAFYSRVDTTFPGPGFREVRGLLKTGDYDLISAIPDISVGEQSVTYTELSGAVAGQRQALQEREEGLRRLSSLLKVVRNPADVAPADLEPLAQWVVGLIEEREALDRNSVVPGIAGARFRGHSTDADEFRTDLAILDVLERQPEFASTLLSIAGAGQISAALEAVLNVMSSDGVAADMMATLTGKAGPTIGEDTAGMSHREVAEYLAEAALDDEGIHVHAQFGVACQEMDQCGFGWVVDELAENDIPLTELPKILEAVIYGAMGVHVYDRHGAILAKYHGAKLDELRATLARLDREIIELSRRQLRSQIAATARPPYGNSAGRKSELTELALLQHEASKKTKFTPVRDLTRRAGRALLELKPCWMMSPLAVAQYLPSTAMFDLCIIDEASQMPPEDAVGALSRSKQAMVVGDTNQLPPTSFFRKLIDDDEVDEDEAVLDESILELANGVFRPARRLRWHYRSRHSGLISFSNQHIYDNDLIVFPSPREKRPDMGVSLVSVAGRYKSGLNAEEAATMITATLRFMREHPDRSLGLVTLNQKQRDLLLEEWEHALAKDPHAAKYVDDWNERNDGLERFFIKNLENVQGDERDVIFIGTVYGREEPGGTVMQRFGPISGLAGRRRLNVLFSRAKQQIVTFSSMTAADVKADEHSNQGAFLLKRWLEYAATGTLHGGQTTGLDPDSEFEVYVINQLRSMGFDPVPQVGVSGYRIDIGVRHPSWPHGFIMGVECDGATYHSSPSARDRDRLREDVLRGLGWELHRIWSTDWFTNPGKEAARLRSAVEARLDVLKKSGVVSAPITSAPEQAPPDIITRPANHPEVATELTTGPSASSIGQDVTPDPDVVEVGDTVRVIYLDGDKSARVVTLSSNRNAPDLGIVHIKEPLGRALLGAEKAEEVEILVGTAVRLAQIGEITKAGSSKEKAISAPAAVAPQPRTDLFGGSQPSPATNLRLDPERFYEPSYLRTLRPLTCEMVDRFGPMTFKHLSELVARSHGFQRTGSQIKSQVWAAISKERRHSKDPRGGSTIWPKGVEPKQVIPFRGMTVAGERREWASVPYPERIGLAVDVLSKGRGDLPAEMAARVGLARLKQKTREEFETLIKDAQGIKERA